MKILFDTSVLVARSFVWHASRETVRPWFDRARRGELELFLSLHSLAETYNALGSLKASAGKSAEAEALYRDALKRNPSLLPARHNLALLLLGLKGRRKEAEDLWRANLSQSPDYLPSRLSLAEALAGEGDASAAIEQYRAVLKLRPDYIAARLALAGLMSDPSAALGELRQALGSEPDNIVILERIGDAERAAGRNAEAAEAYQAALARTRDSSDRKRLGAKLKARRPPGVPRM